MLHPTPFEFMKKKEITVNRLAEETNIDRRTIRKRVLESGLQPLRRARGAAYYDRGQLLAALDDLLRARSGRDPQGPRDATKWLRENFEALSWVQARLRVPDFAPDDFVNMPGNHEEIQAVVTGDLLAALNLLGDLLGRGEDDEDEN
jgi:HTH domain